MDIWFRNLIPDKWAIQPDGPWSVSNGWHRSIRRNEDGHISAALRLDGRSSVYFSLFGRAGNFSSIDADEGYALPVGMGLEVDLDVTVTGTAKCAAMVLEFDENGERIGTARARAGRSLFYLGNPGVARVLVCIRCSGKGTVRMRSVRVGFDPDCYVSLAQRRFPKAAASGALVTPIGEYAPPVVIPAQETRSFVFAEVPAGHWQVEVRHRSAAVRENRRALVGRLAFSDLENSRELGESVRLPVCSRGYPYSYLGGGRDEGMIRQTMAFTLKEAQRAIVLQLALPIDEDLELESVLLVTSEELERRMREGDHDDARERRLSEGVRQWLEATPQASDARFVLYADIDLNSVDGSSIWMSSMASVLCAMGPCILVAKANVASDIVLCNVQHRENLILLEPAMVGAGDILNVRDACHVVRSVDDALPDLRHVVVRGLSAAADLAQTRRFKGRLHVYLTDFYSVEDSGIRITETQARSATLAVTHAATILTQTGAIADRLKEVTGLSFRTFEVPPAIPADAFPAVGRGDATGPLRIGYAGKINPQWGVVELLDWAALLRREGLAVELDVVANKISGRHPQEGNAFRDRMAAAFDELEVRHHASLNRAQSMSLMAQMDFVWCWRPASLEDHTLELSTKLVEMVANGARCICYPNAINRAALGDDYPFFVRDFEDLRRILASREGIDPALALRIRERHSLDGLEKRLAKSVFSVPHNPAGRRICFAGHDFKFIDPYASRLKAAGYHVVRDVWDWGGIRDEATTQANAEWADTIFCEWGLANAVWYSHNVRPGQRLYIRAHLQEVNPRARKFGRQVDIDNVDKVIFVSERVRDTAVEMFGWPVEKTTVIPNFVLPDEYAFTPRDWCGPIRLGMVGIVPERKRFDRAVDLLIELTRRGHEAQLAIKGPRPETLAFMHGPSREAELRYYNDVYARIEAEPGLAGRVRFFPWGNDVSSWYGEVDHMLSCSDFESFHYALADGVLSGCHPLVWPWDEAEQIYTRDWIVSDTVSAADSIEAFRALGQEKRLAVLQQNRALVEGRYGHEAIFAALDGELGVKPL